MRLFVCLFVCYNKYSPSSRGHTYTKKLFVVFLKFKFYRVSVFYLTTLQLGKLSRLQLLFFYKAYSLPQAGPKKSRAICIEK